jgi:hypothetical protein
MLLVDCILIIAGYFAATDFMLAILPWAIPVYCVPVAY